MSLKKIVLVLAFVLALPLGLALYLAGSFGSSGYKSYVFKVETETSGKKQTKRLHLVVENNRAVLDSFVLAGGAQPPVQTQKVIASATDITTCNFITRECETTDFKIKPQGDRQLMHEFSYDVIDAKASFAGIPCKKIGYRMDMDVDHTVVKQLQNVEADACFADLGSELLAVFPQLSIGRGFHNIEGAAAAQFMEFKKIVEGLVPLEMNVQGTSGLSSALSEELDLDALPIRSQLELLPDQPSSSSLAQFKRPEGFKMTDLRTSNAPKRM